MKAVNKKSFETKVIMLNGGLYFNGVKGHQVRKTKHFKDAKIMNEISDRDKRYLANYSYRIVPVKYSIEDMGPSEYVLKKV